MATLREPRRTLRTTRDTAFRTRAAAARPGLRRYNAIMRFASGSLVAAVLATQLLLPAFARAQQPASPNDGQVSATTPLRDAPSRTPPHAFWDRTNLLLFSGVAVFRGLDYASTRNFQARGREEILIPDDIVNNSAAFASLEVAGALTSIGLSYWMHRAGHHKLERWISIGHIGVTGFGVVRNYSLKSKH
jgi:hypothetical protein